MSILQTPRRHSPAIPAGGAGAFDGTADNVACDQCIYWERLDEGVAADGYCRRYAPPPAVTTLKVAEFDAKWPFTRASEWCGEHRQRPRAVAETGATNT